MAFKMESLLRHLSTVLSTCGDLRLEGIWKGNLFLVIVFIRERNPASISVRSSPVLSLAINCPSSPIHWAPSPRLPQGHQTGPVPHATGGGYVGSRPLSSCLLQVDRGPFCTPFCLQDGSSLCARAGGCSHFPGAPP